jgi:dTDP-4-amino-4,6-dideoxygalactose transaminase
MDDHSLAKLAFSNEFNAENVMLVSNGTHAIEVVLTAMDLPRGSLVIVPEISFIATAIAVARVGLIPVYADVSPHCLGMTIDAAEERYQASVSAIIVVHFAGMIDRDILNIKSFCEKKSIALVEDVAQAHCAKINGQRAGCIGDAATFSFQTSKLISSGEGGAIICKTPELLEECEAVSNWGFKGPGKQGNYFIPSNNYRMSQCQARLLQESIESASSSYEAVCEQVIAFQAAARELELPYLKFRFDEEIQDSPFFFVLTKGQTHYQIEPRGQYPMSRSSMVESVLTRWFPDLYDGYKAANASAHENYAAIRAVDEYVFLNLKEFRGRNPVELMEPLVEGMELVE